MFMVMYFIPVMIPFRFVIVIMYCIPIMIRLGFVIVIVIMYCIPVMIRFDIVVVIRSGFFIVGRFGFVIMSFTLGMNVPGMIMIVGLMIRSA